MESEKLKIYQNRLKVAELIEKVITDKLSVADALKNFPKDKNDINIKCAFDALMHREADEDLRKKVKGYKEVQDDYLIEIANILKENQQLPKNIILKYLKYHNQDLISPDKNDFKNTINKLKRMINL